MTEIDHIRRITLRDLKPFFSNFSKVRGQLLDLLEQKPELISEAVEAVKSRLQGSITFSGSTAYNIQGRVNGLGELDGFDFRWADDGEERKQRVRLATRPSNLGLGTCYYFVCPYTGRICRKLYTDGKVLISRYGFRHTYSSRNYSHRWRSDKRALDFILLMGQEHNQAGKRERYRGKPTRFGRKLAKMAGEVWKRLPFLAESLISRRGRPRASR